MLQVDLKLRVLWAQQCSAPIFIHIQGLNRVLSLGFRVECPAGRGWCSMVPDTATFWGSQLPPNLPVGQVKRLFIFDKCSNLKFVPFGNIKTLTLVNLCQRCVLWAFALLGLLRGMAACRSKKLLLQLFYFYVCFDGSKITQLPVKAILGEKHPLGLAC